MIKAINLAVDLFLLQSSHHSRTHKSREHHNPNKNNWRHSHFPKKLNVTLIKIKKNYAAYWEKKRERKRYNGHGAMWLFLMQLFLIGPITTWKSTYEASITNSWEVRSNVNILDKAHRDPCVRDHVAEKYALDETYKPPVASTRISLLGD